LVRLGRAGGAESARRPCWCAKAFRSAPVASPHAIELAREGVSLNVIQRQFGHRNLGVTSIYLQGIDPDEIIQTVHGRRPPMIPASVGLTHAAHPDVAREPAT
jgi:hypothetical protein